MPTSEIYTLSLHDALPIYGPGQRDRAAGGRRAAGLAAPARTPPGAARRLGQDARLPEGAEHGAAGVAPGSGPGQDRKSTRLNSSHVAISYAVFCLKKEKKLQIEPP